MPLGVTSCSENIFNAFLSNDRANTFFHGHSYTANPVGCSAALASLDLLVDGECLSNIKRIESQHAAFVKKHQQSAYMKNVRSTGTILAVDFANNEDTSYFNSLRDRLYQFFLDKGIILRPLGNTVYVLPPYCISNEDLDYVYRAIEEVKTIL